MGLFEFWLHISYRLEFGGRDIPTNLSKSERASLRASNKAKAKAKQLQVQEAMRKKFGLLVDVPKPAGGSTNDGNCARTAFRRSDEFAYVLGLDKKFAHGLYIILMAINSQLQLHCEKFGKFCYSVAEMYVNLYGWYKMPVTVHKILIHGAEIIGNFCVHFSFYIQILTSCKYTQFNIVDVLVAMSPVPVGLLSEQAADARMKFFRHDRQFFARKMTRAKNLEDVLNRALEGSDPVVGDFFFKFRFHGKEELKLPPEVVNLLQHPIDPLAREDSNFEDNGLETSESLDNDIVLDSEANFDDI